MTSAAGIPAIAQVVLDTTDARALADFYRELLDLVYRPGDERPPDGQPDPRGEDWLVLLHRDGRRAIAFQQLRAVPRVTWPTGPFPQMLHLDTTVPTVEELRAAHGRALALGATVLLDRTDDDEEPLWVFADPAGHPFCVFVQAPPAGLAARA